jgi:hypothetical protein
VNSRMSISVKCYFLPTTFFPQLKIKKMKKLEETFAKEFDMILRCLVYYFEIFSLFKNLSSRSCRTVTGS